MTCAEEFLSIKTILIQNLSLLNTSVITVCISKNLQTLRMPLRAKKL